MSAVIESRCGGHCCRAFDIGGMTPVDIAKMRQDYPKPEHDIHRIGDMLIYLGLHHDRNPVDPSKPWGKGPSHFYTCKHLDTESGLCRDYENRPSMCSRYPYGQRCTYSKCETPDAGLLGDLPDEA